MRSSDARSAQIGSPNSISQCFQVSTYSREPAASSEARNLLSKHDWRLADANETPPVGPQMAIIRLALPFAGAGEGLAGAGAGPHPTVSGPPCKLKSVGPPPDPGKPVTLPIPFNVIRAYLPYITLVDFAKRQLLIDYEIPQPLSTIRINFVVVDHEV